MSAIIEGPYMERTLVVLLEDKPGTLSHVVNLFRRRNFNIESLTVGHSETPGISRLTVVVLGDNDRIEQIIKQLRRLVNVTKVSDISDDAAVIREMTMIKVHCKPGTRSEIHDLANIYRAQIIDVALESMIIEITGTQDKVDSLIDLLRPFGIKEISRTGSMGMVRGLSGITNG